jgi:hypothetical protein
MHWIALIPYLLQFSQGLTTAEPPAAAAAREVAVPIQVVGPGEERLSHHAEISIFVLSQQGGQPRRGKLVLRGTTGAKGDPFVARLAPSADRLLVEAREPGGGKPVLASAVIAVDPETSMWRSQGSLPAGLRGERASDVVPSRSEQQPVLVRIPERVQSRIYVVASQFDRLPNFVEVMVFATNGKCVRRGSPRRSGEGFDAEREEPLDPRYQRLWVVARGRQVGQQVTGSMLLVFDHNNWRPATRYEEFLPDAGGQTGSWRPETDYDRASGVFAPILDAAVWTPSQIRVTVPAQPLPVWTPGATADAACSASLPCCGGEPEADETGLLESLGLGKEPPLAPAVEEIAARDAAVVEAGRPLAPEHKWAGFGSRWVRGPYNMCWETSLSGDRL